MKLSQPVENRVEFFIPFLQIISISNYMLNESSAIFRKIKPNSHFQKFQVNIIKVVEKD